MLQIRQALYATLSVFTFCENVVCVNFAIYWKCHKLERDCFVSGIHNSKMRDTCNEPEVILNALQL